MRLKLNKIYRVQDEERNYYVEVIDELDNWEYDYNTYKCVIISKGSLNGSVLIIMAEMWNVFEVSNLELELL